MIDERTLKRLSDEDLLRRLNALLHQSRRVEAELVAHIAEVDARRLYASRAASSMFQYAIEVLHLSEAEAYLRIAVARASRMHPVLLEMLRDGRLHLTGIALLAKHLTASNRDAVLARAAHKTKREVEELIAELAPRPDVAASIRKQPVRRSTTAAPAPAQALRPDKVTAAPEPKPQPAPVPVQAPKPAVEPLAPERYKVTFTADAALRDKLRRLEALMESDLAEVIDAAITEKLERLEAARFAKTKAPRKTLEETETASELVLPASRREEGGLRTRRRSVHLRRRLRPPLHRAEPARVPPRRPVRQGRRPHGRQHPIALQNAQFVSRRARVREKRDGRVSSLG